MKKISLKKYIPLFRRQKIVVLGDVMLDSYLMGRATRISQEAPVPVVLVREQRTVLGGAANVARNVLSLGGRAEVVGICGRDLQGESLLGLLAGAGAGVSGMVIAANRPTTVKTRVLAGNQQVVRIDQEQSVAVSPAHRRRMRENVEEFLADPSVGGLILEDYAKGVFGKDFMQSVVLEANRRGKIVALDPHPRNTFYAKGLTLMTPNRAEAFALAGMEYVSGNGKSPLEDMALAKVAGRLMSRWKTRYLLVTLGADGMALFQDGAAPIHIPTVAQQVFDVSGAGDTVMATMVLSMLSGASPEDAARIANSAAGVVVGRVGTSAIESEVLASMLE